MKRSTLKRLNRKWQNLPVYFVYTSVFLEIVFGQSRLRDCVKFFDNVGFRYRLITSTIVIGETIKSINKLANAEKERWVLWFLGLIEKAEIELLTISSACLTNVTIIRNADTYLESSDAIIFSSAITESCKAFITLDSDFSTRLSIEFMILIKKPSEA